MIVGFLRLVGLLVIVGGLVGDGEGLPAILTGLGVLVLAGMLDGGGRRRRRRWGLRFMWLGFLWPRD